MQSLTPEQAHRIVAAAILAAEARAAHTEVERIGGGIMAGRDSRQRLSEAERELARLVEDARRAS